MCVCVCVCVWTCSLFLLFFALLQSFLGLLHASYLPLTPLPSRKLPSLGHLLPSCILQQIWSSVPISVELKLVVLWAETLLTPLPCHTTSNCVKWTKNRLAINTCRNVLLTMCFSPWLWWQLQWTLWYCAFGFVLSVCKLTLQLWRLVCKHHTYNYAQLPSWVAEPMLDTHTYLLLLCLLVHLSTGTAPSFICLCLPSS